MEDMGVLWTWKCNCGVMGNQNGKEIQKVGTRKGGNEMLWEIKMERNSKSWGQERVDWAQGRKAIWTLAGRFGFYVQIILPDFNHNYRV